MNNIHHSTGTNREQAHELGARCAAFTLIEAIGVLAVLTVLATMLLSNTTRRMDQAASALENSNLVSYASAFQNSILRTRSIPNSNNVAGVIADELGISVFNVKTNARNNQRAFLFDPKLFIGTSVGGQGYQQTILGAGLKDTNAFGLTITKPPDRPRLMILSSQFTNFPSAVYSGFIDSEFVNLWNRQNGTFPSDVPAFNTWGGKADDLLIQRISLSPLFAHIVLYNYNYPSVRQGRYAIDRDLPGALTNTVPSNNTFPNTNGVDAFYFKGTMLSLLKSNDALDVDWVVSRDTSFGYVQDVWRSTVNISTGVDPRAALLGNAMWATAATFITSPYTTAAKNGVTPLVVYNDIYNFMSNYVNWANPPTSPIFQTGPLSNLVYVSQRVMIDDITRLSGDTPVDTGNAPNITFNTGGCTNAPPLP